MKVKRKNLVLISDRKTSHKNVSNFVYVFLGLVTVAFYTTFADPFNVPKFILLLFLTAWALPYLITSINFQHNRVFFAYFILNIFFLLSIFISSLLSDVKQISFFGDSLRRDGFITYFGFSCLSLYLSLYFSKIGIKRFLNSVLLIALIVSTYGILQFFKIDFVSWTGSAGIISTYGNSNFAGSGIAIFAVLLFGLLFCDFRSRFKLFVVFVFLLCLVSVRFSNARQASLVLIFTLTIIVLINLFERKPKFLVISLGTLFSISLVALLGIFNKGPFAGILFKESIRIRTFYWRAAIKMFESKPWFGVGFDRYGAYFKEYRDSEYPIRYGFDITSTNAHNVPLQLLSTAGLFALISYLTIIFYISKRGLVAYRSSSGSDRKFIVAVYAAWVTFQLQSLFSIDFIGVAIWGWSLGGILIALSSEDNVSISIASQKKEVQRSLLKIPLSIVALVVSIQFFRAESGMYLTRIIFDPAQSSTISSFQTFATKTLKVPLLDLDYQSSIGGYLIDYKLEDQGKLVLENALKKDSRSQSTLNGLALFAEMKGNYSESIEIRKRIEILDPWNAKNFLQLTRLYNALGDEQMAKIYFNKIMRFASTTEMGLKAKTEFPKF